MTTPLRLVVFDVDGTLVDSQDHIHTAMTRAFAGVGLPAPQRAAVLSIVGLSLPQAVVTLVPDLPEGDRLRIAEGYKAAYSALRAERMAPLYPGALNCVQTLAAREDLLLGIATGKSRKGLGHVLAAYELDGVFFTRQVADDHPSKPHPSMLWAALAETGVSARHAVMVGDTTYDIEMARAAGMQAIGVAWGYHDPAALTRAGAAGIVTSFAGLPAALEAVWASVD